MYVSLADNRANGFVKSADATIWEELIGARN
jgi:hypothetical protein